MRSGLIMAIVGLYVTGPALQGMIPPDKETKWCTSIHSREEFDELVQQDPEAARYFATHYNTPEAIDTLIKYNCMFAHFRSPANNPLVMGDQRMMGTDVVYTENKPLVDGKRVYRVDTRTVSTKNGGLRVVETRHLAGGRTEFLFWDVGGIPDDYFLSSERGVTKSRDDDAKEMNTFGEIKLPDQYETSGTLPWEDV